jgi:hypothetical protein
MSGRITQSAGESGRSESTGILRAGKRVVKSLCARLQHGIPMIVSRWREMTDREPWDTLSDHDRVNHLPSLLSALLESAAGDPMDPSCRELLLREGVTHGSQRRVHLFSPEAVLEEYHHLRRAIWEAMSADVTATDAVTEIIRVDSGITVATVASLHGLYRAEPEDEPWTDIVTELAAGWSHATV